MEEELIINIGGNIASGKWRIVAPNSQRTRLKQGTETVTSCGLQFGNSNKKTKHFLLFPFL